VTNARLAAVDVLLAVERGRTTLSAEIDRARRGLNDERDRALLVELAAGTLRWLAKLDALLSQCSSRPLAEIDPVVRAILRIAAYQLEQLDRIPPHAVLNEAVASTRPLRRARAAAFVNAVLRAWRRSRGRMVLPRRPTATASMASQISYLTVTCSHPEWLVRRWLARHGFEATERWCHFNNATPTVCVRPIGSVDLDRLTGSLQASGIDAVPAGHVMDAVCLPAGALGRVPADLLATLVIQDEASQIVAHAVGVSPEERVLDLCAAPGGKTVVLAADLRGSGLVVASDYRPGRVRLLRRTLRRAALGTPVVALDATRQLPFRPLFDRVLVDAPCSGLGVIGRDPDLKWSRLAADLAAFASTQISILLRAADAVRPGGVLVYATCSSEPEENESVVEAFLGRDSRFSLGRASPGPLVRHADDLIDETGFLRTLPFRDDLDAFFAATLVRQNGA